MSRRPDLRKIDDISNESDRYVRLKGTAKVANINERFDDTTHNDNPYDDAIQYLGKKIEDIIDESNLQNAASASYDSDIQILKSASGSFASDIQGKVSLTGNETVAGRKTFSDRITGDITGQAGSAQSATKVTVTPDEFNANHPLIFIDDTTPDAQAEALKASRVVTVNPAASSFTVGGLTVTYTQGDGRSTFGTVTFSGVDAGGQDRSVQLTME